MGHENTKQSIDGEINEPIGELNSKEVQLILQLRTHYRWGEISILMQDGIPQQIIKTVVRQKL